MDKSALLLLLNMNGVSAKPRAILLNTQLFSTWLTTDGVVVITGFLTNEEHDFFFLLRLGHSYETLTIYLCLT